MSTDTTHIEDPSEAWRAFLAEPGSYEHHCESREDLVRTRRLGFAWRRVLRKLRLSRGARVFELGCGGGRHLATLALQGFEVHGVDVSPEVAERARQYLASVARFAPIRATVEVANFLAYDEASLAASFDMCFHVGVVEHFLDAEQRALIWRKMYVLTRPGGWVVSMVPCGKHPLRERIRRERLMGYTVPEMDYGSALHTSELKVAGFGAVTCMAHNFFGFVPAHPSAFVRKVFARPLLLLGNATLPWIPLPVSLVEQVANTLLVVAQKPLTE